MTSSPTLIGSPPGLARAGIVATQGRNSLPGTIDHHRGDAIPAGLTAFDRRFGDRLGNPIGEIAMCEQLAMGGRDEDGDEADHADTGQ